MRRFLFLVVALFLILTIPVASEVNWYKGVPHNHCKDFSDGTSSASEVKTLVANKGCDFLVETDHFEQMIVKSTIAKYLETFDCLGPQVKGKNEQLLCVAGAEFMATKNHGPHILLLHLEKEMPGYRDNMGQEELVRWLKENAPAPIIIAHPYWSTYQYDFSLSTGYLPDGVEIFNYGNYAKTRDAYLKGKGKIATSGWDYHTPLDPTNNSRFKHITYVWVNGKLTAESLLSAIANGQTYASSDGAKISKLNYLPSFTYQKVSRPKFDFEVSFPKSTLDKRVIQIYRDKELVAGSKKSYPIGATKLTYSWADSQASIGDHEYHIEAEGYLVTSPICLSVQNPPEESSLASEYSISIGARLYTGPFNSAPFVNANYGGGGSSDGPVDFQPVKNSRTTFNGLSTVDVYVIFRRPAEMKGKDWNRLAYVLKVRFPSGIIRQSPDGNSVGGWDNNMCTDYYYITLNFGEKGIYKIELWDGPEKKCLVRQSILVR